MTLTPRAEPEPSEGFNSWAEFLPLPTARIHANGTLIWANRAWADLNASEQSSDLTSTFSGMHGQDFKGRWLADVAAQAPFQLLVQAPTGRIQRLHASPIPAGQWLVTCTDVHDQVQEVLDLQRECHKLQTIIDANADCIKVLSLDGLLLSMNVGGMRVMEVDDFQACLNAVWPTFWQGETRELADHALDEARQGRVGIFEGFCPTMKGTPKWWEVTLSPIRNQDGEVINLLSTSRDITQRHEFQEELKALNSTLEERILQRTQELQRSNEELERFAYVAAHDLQEPLRTVQSFSELLGKRYAEQIDERGRKYLDLIQSGATRMKVQVNDLLSYSRLRHEQPPLQPISLEIPLREALLRLKGRMRETEAEFTYDPLPTVLGDGAQLAQVLQNLISNALKFTRRGVKPCVRLTTRQENGEWHFTLSDNGIGIEEAYLEQIFQMFKRLNAREQYEGTGMGLPIAAHIVKHHGGRIWAERTPEGTNFHFTLKAASISDAV